MTFRYNHLYYNWVDHFHNNCTLNSTLNINCFWSKYWYALHKLKKNIVHIIIIYIDWKCNVSEKFYTILGYKICNWELNETKDYSVSNLSIIMCNAIKHKILLFFSNLFRQIWPIFKWNQNSLRNISTKVKVK